MVLDDLKTNNEPFYSKDNIAELERRVNDLKTGKSKCLKALVLLLMVLVVL